MELQNHEITDNIENNSPNDKFSSKTSSQQDSLGLPNNMSRFTDKQLVSERCPNTLFQSDFSKEECFVENEKCLNEVEKLAYIGHWSFNYLKNQLIWSLQMFSIYNVPLEIKPSPELFINLTFPEDRHYIEEVIDFGLNQKVSNDNFVCRIVIGSQKLRIVQFHIKIIRDSYSNKILVFGIVQDITKPKMIETELRKSETNFKQIAENIKEVFWIRDLANNCIIYVSPAYEAIWGKSCESLYNNPNSFLDTIHPEDKDRIMIAMRNQQNGAPFSEEFRIIHSDKSEKWVWSRTFLLKNDKGEIYKLIGIAEDITKRKITELSLQENIIQLDIALKTVRDNQKSISIIERMKVLGQFASGVAHDINNSLTPVFGYIDLMADDEEVIRRFGNEITKIKISIKDIRHTIQRMKEFYHAKSDIKDFVPVNINDIVRTSIDLTKQTWKDFPESTGNVIELDINLANENLMLDGDESELREAIINLIINAADAMPHGGSISFNTYKDNDYVYIEIRDSGIGMNEKILSKCLDPFFTTKGDKGSGLGLSIVHRVIMRHKGTIKIDSHENEGTTFTIIFPKTDNNYKYILNSNENIASLNILLVDDDLEVRKSLEKMLEKLGHNVEVADSGRNGIELFKEMLSKNVLYDLVITDLGMAHMDGKSFAKILKTIIPQIYIILLTGWGSFLDNKKFKEVDCILNKPITLDELKSALYDYSKTFYDKSSKKD